MPRPASSPVWSRSPRPAARSHPVGAIALGLVAGGLCALAVGLKYKFGYDDSLDVVGVHLVGGLVGTVGVGLPEHRRAGLFYGDGIKQLVVQVMVVLVASPGPGWPR